MAKKTRNSIRAEKVTSEKKMARAPVKKKSTHASKKTVSSKRIVSPILGRMKGTVHYDSDLTKPIDEHWDADFENT